MPKFVKVLAPFAAVIALLFGLSACNFDDSSKDGQDTESASGQSNYDNLVAQDPAHDYSVSPTRKTINFYADTWGKQAGKLAYTYLLDGAGDINDYVVTVGPPVSMCTSIRPTYKLVKPDITGDNTVVLSVPAPSSDGAYYSGGECNTYYGRDANSGAFVEFSVGNGQSFIIRDQPFSPEMVKGATNLGDTK